MDKGRIAGSVVVLALGVTLGTSVAWLPAAMGYRPWLVAGSSMRETLHDGDVVYAKPGAAPSREDIVIAESPAGWETGDDVLIKRVVASPGDEVTLDSSGRLHRGGSVDSPLVDSREKQWDSGCDATANGRSKTIRLGGDEWLLRGDNVNNSSDSRWAWCRGEDPAVGTAQIDAVVKRAIPLGRALDALTPSD